MPPKYTYRDFVNPKKKCWTRGTFIAWTQDGPLNAWGAFFHRRASDLWIPEYLLTPETRKMLPPIPQGEHDSETR